MGQPNSILHVALAKNDLLIESCGFDSFERAVLGISRRFFATFSEPEAHGWMEAFEEAERVFPPPFGATLALAVMRAIRVLRQSRRTVFNFAHPDCAICDLTITQEERYLISTLRSVRRSQRSEALTYALLVCEGCDPEQLVQAFEVLCVIIGEGPLATAS